jgi:hypothetical protein
MNVDIVSGSPLKVEAAGIPEMLPTLCKGPRAELMQYYYSRYHNRRKSLPNYISYLNFDYLL